MSGKTKGKKAALRVAGRNHFQADQVGVLAAILVVFGLATFFNSRASSPTEALRQNLHETAPALVTAPASTPTLPTNVPTPSMDPSPSPAINSTPSTYGPPAATPVTAPAPGSGLIEGFKLWYHNFIHYVAEKMYGPDCCLGN